MPDIKFDEERQQWQASIEVNGKTKTIGFFESVADALLSMPHQDEFSWMD